MISEPELSLDGRLALVTGATRGIGRAVAKAMAEAGAHVIALGRVQGSLESLDDEIQKATGKPATLLTVDLRDGDTIDRMGAAIHERWGKLDVLVGAAGVLGATTPIAHFTPKVWDETIQVNLTANYRLIRSLDPLLRASDSGRAIFLTSGAARRIHAFWSAYAASKAGLEALAWTYAEETEQTNVRVAVVNPGPMRTKMRALAFPGEDPTTLPEPEKIAPLIISLAAGSSSPPRQVIDFKA